jgi:hypothetical protein
MRTRKRPPTTFLHGWLPTDTRCRWIIPKFILATKGPTQNALQEFASEDLVLVRRSISNRERERRIKEAEEGLAACADATTKTPDDAGKAIFERSQGIWHNCLAALNS